MGDANAWVPPQGVRGQFNDRFEQRTIGCLVSAPLRHWVPVLNTWATRRLEPDAFLRAWEQEEQAMDDAIRASFEIERDALRELLADAKPENDDGD